MSSKRRVGIVGFGHLGQYVYRQLPRSDFQVVFVWNRTKDNLIGKVPDELVLDSLEDFQDRNPDLIVEVAHPDVTRKLGVQFLRCADYLVGSPTALSDPDIMDELREVAKGHGLYVPSGALWGGEDIRKMDQLGDLQELDTKEEKPEEKLRDGGNWKRQRMSSETIQELEAEYCRQPKPTRVEIEKLAAKLGQRENNIYAWFYRRRNREVRDVDHKSADSADDDAPKRSSPQPTVVLPSRRRNSRTSRFFSKEELTVLENVFARQNHPGGSEIGGLARWFQKDGKKISAWFARRRLKFTKDFVKNIDADSYVSPVSSTPDALYESSVDNPMKLDTEFQSQAFSRERYKLRKELQSKIQSDDEECDVVGLSPSPPSEESLKLSCLACTPRPALPLSLKREHEEAESTVRESVIQWYSRPTKTSLEHAGGDNLLSPVQPSISAFRTIASGAGPYRASVNRENFAEDREPPRLLPVEWVFRYQNIFPFGHYLAREPRGAAMPQWCVEHLNKFPSLCPEDYTPLYEARKRFKDDADAGHKKDKQ